MVLRLQDLTPSSSNRVLTHYFFGNDMYSQFGHPRSEVRDLSNMVFRDAGLIFPIWRLGFWHALDLRDCAKIWDWKTGVNYISVGDPQPRTLPWAVTSQGETRPLFPRLRPGECLGTRLSQELGDPLMLLFLWREQNIHVEEICTTHKKPKIGKKKTKKTQAWALLLLLWLMFRIAGITKNANNRGSGFNDFFDRNIMFS